MEHLPGEIIFNILSRLPVTSLIQMKLVCRTWRNMARDPLFLKKHFFHMTHNNPCLILHYDYPINNELYLIDLPAQTKDNVTAKNFNVHTLPDFNVVGSCNGLLCLSDSFHANVLFIYNPFTRDCIELPETREDRHQAVVHGFGYHPSTKQYKVVKIVHKMIRRGCKFSYAPSNVQVLTLGNPTWRSVGNISHHLIQCASHFLVNGRLHWMTWPMWPYKGHAIISFDLADEQFREVSKPNGLKKVTYSLSVLGDYLSAGSYCNGGFEIWVLKEYHAELWIKEYSIGMLLPPELEQDVDYSYFLSQSYLDASIFRVICLLKSGEILLEYKQRALVCYNPKSGTLKEMKVHGMPNWFEAVVHVGNLNSVDSFIQM